MTTLWQPDGSWRGATVAVIGAGPSATAEAVASLRYAGHRMIAVNDACTLAPDADMLVALDGGWPRRWREFAGLRVCGIDDPRLDALYIGHRFERVTLGPMHQVEIRNSGLAAIRVAAEMGAAKIILCGFDPELADARYVGLAQGLAALTAELAAQGVRMERVAVAQHVEGEAP